MKILLLNILTLITFSFYSQTYEDTIAYDQMESFDWSGNWWSNAPTTGFYSNASVSPPASAVIYGSGSRAGE